MQEKIDKNKAFDVLALIDRDIQEYYLFMDNFCDNIDKMKSYIDKIAYINKLYSYRNRYAFLKEAREAILTLLEDEQDDREKETSNSSSH